MFPGQSSAGPDIVSRACRRTRPPSRSPTSRVPCSGRRARQNISTRAEPGFAAIATRRSASSWRHRCTWRRCAPRAIEAGSSLGLSLGEYSHLVHIGALDLDEALRLVDERGRCYDEAPPGIMATVLAVDHDTVASVVERARALTAPIAISNVNAPTQHVIAGAEPAVAWAADDARGRACGARHDHRAPGADALADDGAGRGRLRAGVGAGAVADRRRRPTCRMSPATPIPRQPPPTSSRTSRGTSASRCCGSAPSIAWSRPTRTPRSSKSGRAACSTT